MQKLSFSRHKKYWFIVGPVIFVVLFASLIAGIYKNTLDDIKKDHQFQQLEMTKSTAQGITYLIHHLTNDLKLLSSYPGIKDINPRSLSFISQFPMTYESQIVRSVFAVNRNFKVCCFLGETVEGWALDYTKQAVLSGSTQGFYISAVSSNELNKADPRLYFQLLVPILNKSSASDTIGFLGYLINFNGLVDQFIKPLKLSKNDFAWIIDGMGRLIYHPLHSEMLLRSLNNTSPECFRCHNSFSIQQSIINASKPSFGEYAVVDNEPVKIMAYFPMTIGNQKWVLVISTLVTHVTESLRDKFKVFFIIGFIILGLLLAFSSIVYVINSRRIRAEEARRNLEQIQLYQEQLNQASKLASIGELVDSVAHEINTPAGIIAAHVDGILLSKNPPPPDGISSTLKIIKKQTERISNYTRSLLGYSQRMSFYPEPVNIKSVLEECIYLLGHRFRSKRIRINRYFESNLPKVPADTRQMEQVFINLLNNAIDAVDHHGEINLTLRSEETAGERNVIVSIEDNGSGISEDNLTRIFTPFFTTKQNSNGTGLGLSIVKAIISRHQGKITVHSEPGKCTAFKITLPGILNKA